jgi:hypothetical protein
LLLLLICYCCCFAAVVLAAAVVIVDTVVAAAVDVVVAAVVTAAAVVVRAVARRGNWESVYSYIHVHIPKKQSLSKEICRAEHENMNMHPLPVIGPGCCCLSLLLL